MEAKREQALVGVFVLVVAALLIVTVFALTGAFSRSAPTYRARFSNAGGLEPGAEVRYAEGPKVGRVEALRIDPKDPLRIEITFSVRPDIPVKTDSVARILSLSPLGENHLEITPGGASTSRAHAGDTLPSAPYVGFNDLTIQLNQLAPEVKQLIESLNERTGELHETIARVNDLLNDRNRANLAEAFGNVRGLLEENRPKLRSTMTHVESSSAKLGPLLDELKKAAQQADQTLAHIDGLVSENRPDVHEAVEELRRTLGSTSSLAAQLDRTMTVNSENIDELLENLRHTSENLKEFTDRIKARPSMLIRGSSPRDHKPGEAKP